MITKLPIHAVLDQLSDALLSRHEVVLEAPPGAGKTTVVPLEFLNAPWLGDQKILVLEPRRLATRGAAQRMAELLGESVGDRVGYRMRLDSKTSSRTIIEVITEGILNRMLLTNPALDGVGMVIFDEFHERSLDADLGLALCLKGREIFRDTPLKLVVMSATLEGSRLAALLGDAPVVTASGKAWPVDINYSAAAKPRERISDRASEAIERVLKQHPKSSLLVFLPGEGEIRQVMSNLNVDADTVVAPLFGNLSIQDQRLAIAPPSTPDTRKVVLATNIAETSLTIEGIEVVLDSGLERVAKFDPNTAMTRLTTQRISQASATQRAGRAGRLGPGVCYRLWSEEQQRQLTPHGVPEILQADLAPLALQLLQWGVFDPNELSWLDSPGQGAWQQALSLLRDLGALLSHNPGSSEADPGVPRLSKHGELMARLPLPPRLAHMLICGASVNASNTVSVLAGLLSERDPFSSSHQYQPDIQNRLDVLLGQSPCPAHLEGWRHQVLTLAKKYEQDLARLSIDASESINREDLCGYLIASAYPDRIGRKRHAGGYQLANGRSASLQSPDKLGQQRWLAVAEVGGAANQKGDTIRTAATLNHSLFERQLAHLKRNGTRVEWDKKTGRFVAEDQTTIGALVISRTNLDAIPETAKSNLIIDMIAQQGMSIFGNLGEFNAFRQRVALVKQHTNQEWPDLGDDALLTSLKDWLAPYLTSINKLGDLKALDLTQIWRDQLGYQKIQSLDQLAPVTVAVPSGSKIRINYLEDPPVLPVKLQEMFGQDETPTIVGGQVPLLCHLLSPAGRPLQITQDLSGFWRSSYQDVKKEMKGRYPKHPWPDDPTVATATMKTKNRL